MDSFARDSQIKTMESTVTHAEKYLGLFCTLFASYTRKTAKLRDKADLIVKELHDFANTEDPELRTCLKILAEDLAMVQDYRQAQVERLEARVVTPLKAYGEIVKNKRADLKKFSADRNRELKELQRLEKIRQRNPSDRQSISQAEVNAQKASTNVNRSTRQLEETIGDFQRQKLDDIKRIFTDFLTVEMLFHAKALEVYSHTIQIIKTMDLDKDLEMFRGRIQVLEGSLDSHTMQSLHSTSSLTHYSSPSPSALRQTSEYSLRPGKSVLLRRSGAEQEEEEMYESEDEEEDGSRTTRESYAAGFTRSLRSHKR